MGIFFGRDSDGPQSETLETVVGPSASLKGHLKSDGGVRIDGVFEGVIEVAGNVVIGDGARVVADVTARNITVAGAVKGNIDGSGRLEILSGGEVYGDIMVAAVMIDEGAIFQGTSRMRGMEQRALTPPRDEAEPEAEVEAVHPDDTDAVDVAARPAREEAADREEVAPARRERQAAEPGAADEGDAEAAARAEQADAAVEDLPDLDLDDIEPIIPDVVIEDVSDEDGGGSKKKGGSGPKKGKKSGKGKKGRR
jgi:cytoskeletal protein CcmA (bactofilin family)